MQISFLPLGPPPAGGRLDAAIPDGFGAVFAALIAGGDARAVIVPTIAVTPAGGGGQSPESFPEQLREYEQHPPERDAASDIVQIADDRQQPEIPDVDDMCLASHAIDTTNAVPMQAIPAAQVGPDVRDQPLARSDGSLARPVDDMHVPQQLEAIRVPLPLMPTPVQDSSDMLTEDVSDPQSQSFVEISADQATGSQIAPAPVLSAAPAKALPDHFAAELPQIVQMTQAKVPTLAGVKSPNDFFVQSARNGIGPSSPTQLAADPAPLPAVSAELASSPIAQHIAPAASEALRTMRGTDLSPHADGHTRPGLGPQTSTRKVAVDLPPPPLLAETPRKPNITGAITEDVPLAPEGPGRTAADTTGQFGARGPTPAGSGISPSASADLMPETMPLPAARLPRGDASLDLRRYPVPQTAARAPADHLALARVTADLAPRDEIVAQPLPDRAARNLAVPLPVRDIGKTDTSLRTARPDSPEILRTRDTDAVFQVRPTMQGLSAPADWMISDEMEPVFDTSPTKPVARSESHWNERLEGDAQARHFHAGLHASRDLDRRPHPTTSEMRLVPTTPQHTLPGPQDGQHEIPPSQHMPSTWPEHSGVGRAAATLHRPTDFTPVQPAHVSSTSAMPVMLPHLAPYSPEMPTEAEGPKHAADGARLPGADSRRHALAKVEPVQHAAIGAHDPAPAISDTSDRSLAEGAVLPADWGVDTGRPVRQSELPVVIPHPPHNPAQDTARAAEIARQITPVLEHLADGTTEIRLDPVELGRLLLTLQPTDSGLTIAIQAERPDIADLMRRHLDSLVTELRSLGYAEVSVQLSDGGAWGQNPPGQTMTGQRAMLDHDAASAVPDMPLLAPKPIMPAGALDIRL